MYLPETSGVFSSVCSELHVDDILIIGGIKCERELRRLVECPVVTSGVPVVVVLNTELVPPLDVEGLAEKAEFGTGGNVEKPSAPALPAIRVVVWVVWCLYSHRTSFSKVECVATF